MTNELPTVYVGVDVSKSKLAVAMAGGRVREDVLSLGTLENAPASVDRLLKKLSGREAPVSECH
jgi:transposase